jgi:hypothetical protein
VTYAIEKYLNAYLAEAIAPSVTEAALKSVKAAGVSDAQLSHLTTAIDAAAKLASGGSA